MRNVLALQALPHEADEVIMGHGSSISNVCSSASTGGCQIQEN